MYLKQCYANAFLYNKNKADDANNKFKNNGYLNRICVSFSEAKLVKAMLIYITISVNYVIFSSLMEIDYSMNPITVGFCTSEYVFILIPLKKQ